MKCKVIYEQDKNVKWQRPKFQSSEEGARDGNRSIKRRLSGGGKTRAALQREDGPQGGGLQSHRQCLAGKGWSTAKQQE